MTKIDRILRMEKMIDGAKDLTNDQLVKFVFDKVLNKKLSLKTNDMLYETLRKVLSPGYRYEEIFLSVRQMLYIKEDKDFARFYKELKNASLATAVTCDGRKIPDYYYYLDNTAQDEIDHLTTYYTEASAKTFKKIARMANKSMINEYISKRSIEMLEIKRQAS